MKLTQDTTPVETGVAVEAPKQFKIAASKEAFKILSSGLYNNKKLAIIRELSCNAYDAHVAAGKKDVPFEIHLPTAWESFFSVKDNGIGLSHDEVINLYTTYFGTNKSESNDFVGALGLGSKSPFCYTEGFTVTSRYQGKTRIYSCFIDQNGMPAVQLQEENDTPDEVNGLEVMFPVNQNDIWEFENQAKTALEFFDPKPILNTSIECDSYEYIVKTSKWGLRKDRQTKHGSGIRAIQGMVQYAVGAIDESRLSTTQEAAIRLPLDIFFNIGDLAVAASRETLSNDERTIGNILKELDGIKESLLQSVKDEITKCTTHWEARLKVFSMINTEGIGRLVNDAWNRGELDGSFPGLVRTAPKINILDYPNVELFAFFHRYSGNQKARVGRDPKKFVAGESRGWYDVEFKIEQGSVFVINDLGFGGEKYINQIIRGVSKYRTAYFITRRNKNISVVDVKKEGLKIVEALGGPPVLYLTNLRAQYQENYPTIKQPSTPVRKLLIFDTQTKVTHKRDGYTVQGWNLGWSDATKAILPSGTKYYVPIKRLEPQTGDIYFGHAEEFQRFILAVRGTGLFGLTKNDEIYGIPIGTTPLPKGKDWVEFTSHVFKQVPKIMDASMELALSLHLKPLHTHIEPVIKSLGESPRLSQSSPLQIFCSEIAKARKGDERVIEKLAIVIQKAISCNLYTPKNLTDFAAKWKEVEKEYPLLGSLNSLYYWDNDEDCTVKGSVVYEYINYIRLVDEERERQLSVVEPNLVHSDTEENNESSICIER